jgi:hypothetical protein
MMMKYMIYLMWVCVFYLPLKLTVRLAPLGSILLSFLIVLFLKKYLPWLKEKHFSELSPFFDKLMGNINKATIVAKECATCKSKIDFKIVFEYDINKNLKAGRRKTYCSLHGLIEWRKVLDKYSGMIIFSEPKMAGESGSFFYEPSQLKLHGYTAHDVMDVEHLLSQFPKRHRHEGVLWLPKDIIGDCREKPLFKKKVVGEYITFNELMLRIREFWKNLDSRFKRAEYWVSEPHGRAGIYIWDSEV